MPVGDPALSAVMAGAEESWFTPREQTHAAMVFVVLFLLAWGARALIPMPRTLFLVLAVLPVPVAFAVATWERTRRRRTRG